jgi:hypothetical protein
LTNIFNVLNISNIMVSMSNSKIKILVELDGDVAKRFEKYKAKEYLKANSTAAFKLIAEKLDELEVAENPHMQVAETV